MAQLSADQLVEASAKAKLEVRAMADKLATARREENEAKQQLNGLRSQVEVLSKALQTAEASLAAAHVESRSEIVKLKSTIAELDGSREEAAAATKALAPETARADKAEADLADFKVEFDGVVSENRRLAKDNDSVNKRLTAFVEAVQKI